MQVVVNFCFAFFNRKVGVKKVLCLRNCTKWQVISTNFSENKLLGSYDAATQCSMPFHFVVNNCKHKSTLNSLLVSAQSFADTA